jgi:predicted SAM-dependent methyltransferase
MPASTLWTKPKQALRRLESVWEVIDRPRQRRRSCALLATADKLHLGCGSVHFEGWANVDFAGPPGTIRWDLTQPLPARPGSIKFIFTEHFIEHITRTDGARLLRHCFELLDRGGVVRISTPNLGFLVEQYRLRRVEEWRDMGWSPQTAAQMLNEALHLWGHLFVYDYEELVMALRDAGFDEPTAAKWGESRYPELQNRETRPYHNDLIIEAVKT